MSGVSKLLTKYFEDFLTKCDKENKEEILKHFKSKDAKKDLDDFVVKNNIRKRKNDSDKDSDLPKKPLSAYFIFSQEKRPLLKDLGVNSDIKSMAEALSKMWKEVKEKGGDELQKYEEMSNKMKSEYLEKMIEYKKKHNIVEVEKPKTAFFYYKQANLDNIKSEFPGITNAEIHKKIQAKWKELQSEKCETVKKFIDMSNKQKAVGTAPVLSIKQDENNDVEVTSSPNESPIRILQKKKKEKKDDASKKKKKKKEVEDDDNNQ